MKDFGTSSDPAVQAQLDRLAALSVPQGRLGLETIRTLLARLGDPHLALPPVFHVAGTNGKGSTCAFLRAMLEAQGHRVHAATSPHLVRYNERIRVAGELIPDARLAELLAEVLDAGSDLAPSFFEVTIAATFLEFARVPADTCVVEVGLGGRFDATNVIPEPVACGIAALGIDHERFLLAPDDDVPAEPLARIAFEKAGIAKPGVPLVTFEYPPQAATAVERVADRVGAPTFALGADGGWSANVAEDHIAYADAQGTLSLPLPTLPGRHQAFNAALAVALLRHQQAVSVSPEAMAAGIRTARWPARLQRLASGPLTGEREAWLDGGHNPSAGATLAEHFTGQRLHLVIGMIEGKNPMALVAPLAPSIASLTAVPVPDHDHYPPEAFGEIASGAPDVTAALAALPDDDLPVLIAGSLYLAGEVLRLNDEWPD
ncbi:bifunctional folylpolyglutamate synthase/dihydrofolate synthase [Pelagerythrobacter aerophilus]|uniref:tetrahydrofolate synthase n=1 Tax=Pelagerythrobacter aerophilus TaxID=2306995 RepID=A0A418NHT0_9SPHN|nr:folylpolyglutamate synthase/dihydrofolate synthase family protein [Pelagerythrobacter aerophilus]RIV78140.1 bifunctional folylpolyglutamate synthase/dihydrofolate synthase [Pelagerythrobacter aerophilus]